MSMTLKFRWQRSEDEPPGPEHPHGRIGVLMDESTHFVEVDECIVHDVVDDDDQMRVWDENQSEYFEYRWLVNSERMDGRLVEAVRDGASRWYVLTNAWLLGPGGETIERIAP